MVQIKSPELCAHIEDAVRHYLGVANWTYRDTTWLMPELDYTITGTTAGMARYRTWMLSFNLDLLDSGTLQDVRDTAGHELAHLVADFLAGHRVVHGLRWKEVMHRFGLRPTRCHSFNVSSCKRQERHSVACPKCGREYMVSTTIRNQMRRGKPRICGTCRIHLVETGAKDKSTRDLEEMLGL